MEGYGSHHQHGLVFASSFLNKFLCILLALSLTRTVVDAQLYSVDPLLPKEDPYRDGIIPCGETKEFRADEWAYIESPKLVEEVGAVSCKWRFLFNNCRLSVSCPTFRLNNFLCMDHLEISSKNGTTKRYCGSKGPKNLIMTEETVVTYRTNKVFNTLGFRCRVGCAGGIANNAVSDDEFPLPAHIADPMNCSCGETNPLFKIVNGVETRVNEFRWMAGLVRKNGGIPFCGGALINSRYVLTAAHCVTGRTPMNLEIILNEHDLLTGSETKRPVIRRAVDQITQHKGYSSRLDFDAAIIRLRDDVESQIDVGTLVPVCLPGFEDKQAYAGQSVTVAGWGTTNEGGTLATALRKVDVNVMTDTDCKRSYPGSITQRMMCAASQSKDACQGDSGGPLIHDDQGRFTQIGVVSWGHGCARPNRPGVYTRVTEIVRWIAQLTADGRYCNE